MKDYTYLNPVVTQRADPYIYKHMMDTIIF